MAVTSLLVIFVVGLIPWVMESNWLRPQSERWKAVIQNRNSLLERIQQLESELQAYQYMDDKRQANQYCQELRKKHSLDALSGFLNSGRFPQNNRLRDFKESSEIHIQMQCTYNDMGLMLTELWNHHPFLQLHTLIIKPGQSTDDLIGLAASYYPEP